MRRRQLLAGYREKRKERKVKKMYYDELESLQEGWVQWKEAREKELELERLRDELRPLMFLQSVLHPQRQLTAVSESLARIEELEGKHGHDT
jgi:hypothetical protein